MQGSACCSNHRRRRSTARSRGGAHCMLSTSRSTPRSTRAIPSRPGASLRDAGA